MMSILTDIVTQKRRQLDQWQQEVSLDYWIEQAKPKPAEQAFIFERALRQQLATGCPAVVAEIKPKAPSSGVLQANLSVVDVVQDYSQAGAVALSVLTDEAYFGGSFTLLEEVRALTSLPLLCKDFVIDPYQVLVAVCAGADAVLLIMKCLDDIEYVKLYELTKSYGLTPVVEVQTEEELQRALLVRPSVVLVNNRDLTTFQIDLATTQRLSQRVPEQTLLISASGLQTAEQLLELKPCASAFLVGSHLMRCASGKERQQALLALTTAWGASNSLC
jgi:indole-3-glycerol phosphate synthase